MSTHPQGKRRRQKAAQLAERVRRHLLTMHPGEATNRETLVARFGVEPSLVDEAMRLLTRGPEPLVHASWLGGHYMRTVHRPPAGGGERGKLDRPVYEQLAAKLRAQLEDDVEVGEPLPSLEQIAHKHGVTLAAAKRAMQELERQGLVAQPEPDGAYVRQPSDAAASEPVQDDAPVTQEDAQPAAGDQPGTAEATAEVVVPDHIELPHVRIAGQLADDLQRGRIEMTPESVAEAYGVTAETASLALGLAFGSGGAEHAERGAAGEVVEGIVLESEIVLEGELVESDRPPAATVVDADIIDAEIVDVELFEEPEASPAAEVTAEAVEEVVDEEAVEEPVADAVVEEAIAEEAVVEDAVVEEAVVKEAVVKEAVVEDAVVEDAVVEDAVVEDAVVEDAVVEDAVVEEAVEETVAEEPVAEEAVAEEAVEEPVTEEAIEEPVTDEAIEEPVAETPVEEPVAEEAIVDLDELIRNHSPISSPEGDALQEVVSGRFGFTFTWLPIPADEPVEDAIDDEPVEDAVEEKPVEVAIDDEPIEDAIDDEPVEDPVDDATEQDAVPPAAAKPPVDDAPSSIFDWRRP